jgi:hypothetical protein
LQLLRALLLLLQLISTLSDLYRHSHGPPNACGCRRTTTTTADATITAVESSLVNKSLETLAPTLGSIISVGMLRILSTFPRGRRRKKVPDAHQRGRGTTIAATTRAASAATININTI